MLFLVSWAIIAKNNRILLTLKSEIIKGEWSRPSALAPGLENSWHHP